MPQCCSCAARAGEAEFLPRQWGERALCVDCAAEAARAPRADLPMVRRKTRRARYRAALRARAASAQGDLVDLVVRAP
jgi:hypothetical protein